MGTAPLRDLTCRVVFSDSGLRNVAKRLSAGFGECEPAGEKERGTPAGLPIVEVILTAVTAGVLQAATGALVAAVVEAVGRARKDFVLALAFRVGERRTSRRVEIKIEQHGASKEQATEAVRQMVSPLARLTDDAEIAG